MVDKIKYDGKKGTRLVAAELEEGIRFPEKFDVIENGRTKSLDIPKNGTILEKFLKYVKTKNTTEDINLFLSAMNAGVLSYGDDVPYDIKMETAEFTSFFCDLFSEEIKKKKIHDFPYILNLGKAVLKEQNEAEKEKCYASATEFELSEAKSLCETLLAMHAELHITALYESGGNNFLDELKLPCFTNKKERDNARDRMMVCCLHAVCGRGVIIISLDYDDNKRTEMFAIRILANGMWVPVGKKELEEANFAAPEELKPDLGKVTYIEIQREIF